MQEHTISTIDFSAATSLERGMECYAEGKYVEATGLFSLVLLSDPENVRAYRQRAECYFHLEEYQKAYDDASRTLALAPDDPQGLFRRGAVLAMHGHLEESLADLNRLLESDRNHIEGLLRRYWVFMQLRQHHAADEDLRTLLVIIPDETPIQFLATQFCLQTGRLDAARTLLSSIVTREPDNVEALKYRGLVWRHLGAPDMAVSDFSHAIDVAGPTAELLVERAVSFIEMGKRTLTKKGYRHALDDLTRVLEELVGQVTRPAVVLNQRALAWTHFADRCWFDKSGYQKAMDDYAEAVRKEPDFAEAIFNRASLQWKLGEHETVLEDCTKLIELQPDHIDALHLRAEAFLKSGDPQRAEQDFQAIDRINATRSEEQDKMTNENRQACEELDCSRFCRCP